MKRDYSGIERRGSATCRCDNTSLGLWVEGKERLPAATIGHPANRVVGYSKEVAQCFAEPFLAFLILATRTRGIPGHRAIGFCERSQQFPLNVRPLVACTRKSSPSATLFVTILSRIEIRKALQRRDLRSSRPVRSHCRETPSNCRTTKVNTKAKS